MPNFNYTVKPFKNIFQLQDFFDSITVENRQVFGGGSTYKEILESSQRDTIYYINSKNENWLGRPLPSSIDDAMKRNTYQLMNEYKKIMNDYIRPRLQEFIKKSEAALETPVLKFTDREIGVFDFDKASSGLMLVYKSYSLSKKEYVEPDEVENYNQDGKILRRLKSDKTPVVNVPQLKKGYDNLTAYKAFKEIYKGMNVFEAIKKYKLKVGGNQAFTSNVKKTFLIKEIKPKNRNAVRVFIKIGAVGDVTFDMYKWNGYLGVALSEMLSYMGYSVSIFGVYVNQYDINVNGHSEEGARCWTVCLKDFDETIHAPSLLYYLSDMTFFRVKVFEYKVKFAQFYNDHFDTGLGRSNMDLDNLEDIVYNFFGKKDDYFRKGKENPNSQFLYYTITNTFSLDESDANGNPRPDSLIGRLGKICMDIVNKNRAAQDRLSQEELNKLVKKITS
jgi:hypothetical protein